MPLNDCNVPYYDYLLEILQAHVGVIYVHCAVREVFAVTQSIIYRI